MSPEETLEHLISITSSRSHRVLNAIYQICIEQLERNVFDFSISTIARLGFNRGIPKAQSIRNKTGENYRALIKAFVDHSPASKKPMRPKSADAWIDEIKDLRLKMLVKILESQLVEARNLVQELIPPGFEICVDDRRTAQVEHKLNAVERRALEYVLSDEFMAKLGLKLGGFGDVVDSSNVRFFKPGTIDAIKKALDYL
ncbi:gamma-mobile-trio protein GmtX [Pseudomonas sp. TMP25]|uniref:gamma-mobile-trio protein GmtX n=1 Tax=Pseudomonas sp. TMP25 TaxID=3136561 RepID=UPI0031019205